MNSLKKPLILASNSPRRKELLTNAGYNFKVDIITIDETFPVTTPPFEVASYISEQKAKAFLGKYEDHVILTADTVVILDNTILGKPKDLPEAKSMLRSLSGKTHQVVTAFSLLYNQELNTSYDIAQVQFKDLTDDEINYYVDRFKPLDKAGAYGIQEWIGMTAIQKMEGSFYTIMGLPIHLVYQALKKY
tara:strand:+ start:1227 stop:1796 length:570 start_codon:yes stop_codon:yes gene_type:complete